MLKGETLQKVRARVRKNACVCVCVCAYMCVRVRVWLADALCFAQFDLLWKIWDVDKDSSVRAHENL